jgi:small subunit ribosomal protein S20
LTPAGARTIWSAVAAAFGRREIILSKGSRPATTGAGRNIERIEMANTSSARKATRKIARRTAINKMRETRMRGSLRAVEEAITAGDGKKARVALQAAEPEIMRAAQQGVIHKNSASRKISRLQARVRKLGA